MDLSVTFQGGRTEITIIEWPRIKPLSDLPEVTVSDRILTCTSTVYKNMEFKALYFR